MGRSGTPSLKDRLQNLFSRAILGGALLLPYRLRVALVGRVMSHVVAPLAGWRKRIRDNLDLVTPEMPQVERERIVRKVADNVGRTLIEIYSGEEFVAYARTSELTGPGVDDLLAARDAGRPIVLVTAHLGNYDAVRGKLSREGFPMAALYRPMANTEFNAHYLEAISTIAEPVYPTDGRGVTSLVKHLKNGGTIGIVADVGSRKAPVLSFFGKPAHTPLSAAEWAMKYDAAMIPIFGIRKEDGFSFEIEVAKPIAHSDPGKMMQSYNDTVEDVVRRYPDQWFWIHRRWKTTKKRTAKLSEAAPPQG